MLILEVFRQRQLRIEHVSAYVTLADLVVASLFVLLGHVLSPSEVVPQASIPTSGSFHSRPVAPTGPDPHGIDAAFGHWHTARRR